jgi:hypothetical protein
MFSVEVMIHQLHLKNYIVYFWDSFLIGLEPGLNFIYVLRTAFMHLDPKCAKKTVKSAVSFGAFGTYERKSCT